MIDYSEKLARDKHSSLFATLRVTKKIILTLASVVNVIKHFFVRDQNKLMCLVPVSIFRLE